MNMMTRDASPTTWHRCPNCGFKFDLLGRRSALYMPQPECPKCGTVAPRRGTNGMWPRRKADRERYKALIERNGGTFLPLYRPVDPAARGSVKVVEVRR